MPGPPGGPYIVRPPQCLGAIKALTDSRARHSCTPIGNQRGLQKPHVRSFHFSAESPSTGSHNFGDEARILPLHYVMSLPSPLSRLRPHFPSVSLRGILPQPHWPPFSSSNTLSSVLPQGLCTNCLVLPQLFHSPSRVPSSLCSSATPSGNTSPPFS